MISSQYNSLLRSFFPKAGNLRNLAFTSIKNSDDESDKKNKNAKNKLNELLLSIVKENINATVEATEKEATKFKKLRRPDKVRDLGEKIADAAKEVVKNVEGDPERNEAEILQKILYKNEKLQKSVLKASGNKTLSELLTGMEVEADRPKKTQFAESKFSRADQVRSSLGAKLKSLPRKLPTSSVRKDIFGSEPINWFNVKEENQNLPALPTWENCKSRELRLSVTHPPSNYFEQMIIWTDRKMLWKFPIDNEQGMEDEKNTSFEEHVFLEGHLEGWCPDKGPIKHFMELVCIGLSRNHYLTAQEKKEHILWYRDFFIDKKALILEIGAGEVKDHRENL